MKAYKIERWDAILPGDSSNSLPMIYIKADSELLKFAQKNNYEFMVEIRGTGSIYDGKKIPGVFDSLLLGPNCKSKYIKNKNWYTISLNSYFYSYPPKLGEVIILGLEEPTVLNTALESAIAQAPEMMTGSNSPSSAGENSTSQLKGMSLSMIAVTLAIIILLAFAIFFLFRNKK